MPTLTLRTVAKFVQHLRRIRVLLSIVLDADAAGHVLQDFERAPRSLAL